MEAPPPSSLHAFEHEVTLRTFKLVGEDPTTKRSISYSVRL
jgi:hypothetical protein